MKMKHDNITTHGIKISVDPRKYKLMNSLCFGYPRNFIPSKLNTFTVPYYILERKISKMLNLFKIFVNKCFENFPLCGTYIAPG